MTPRLYFAYGSNLHPRRLAERVSSALALGPAALEGHVLRFHKRGRDGSGKCDAMRTGRPGDAVLGMLYRLAPADVERLGRVEGVGRGYVVRHVRVRAGAAEADAFTYGADATAIDPTLRPWDWYKTLVIAGARHHRFPDQYVRTIEVVPSRADPDRRRADEHAALLARIQSASG
jgi:hypothetical protein